MLTILTLKFCEQLARKKCAVHFIYVIQGRKIFIMFLPARPGKTLCPFTQREEIFDYQFFTLRLTWSTY